MKKLILYAVSMVIISGVLYKFGISHEHIKPEDVITFIIKGMAIVLVLAIIAAIKFSDTVAAAVAGVASIAVVISNIFTPTLGNIGNIPENILTNICWISFVTLCLIALAAAAILNLYNRTFFIPICDRKADFFPAFMILLAEEVMVYFIVNHGDLFIR